MRGNSNASLIDIQEYQATVIKANNAEAGLANKQDTLVNQVNIKSVNGNSLVGSGDVPITTYRTFPASWTIDGTFAELMQDIENDATAVKGNVYLGEITCSDLPFVGNADTLIEIYDGTGTNKTIVSTINSGTTSPYYWRYTYWVISDVVHTSGWQSFVPTERTINGKALTTDITLTPSDIGAEPTLPTTSTANKVLKSTSTSGVVAWGNGASVTTTTGSEAVSDGTNSVDVATRNTAQTFTGSKYFDDAQLSVQNHGTGNSDYTFSASGSNIQSRYADGTNEYTANVDNQGTYLRHQAQGTNILGHEYEYDHFVGIRDGNIGLIYDEIIGDGDDEIYHSLLVDNEGVKEDGTLLSNIYQAQSDNNLTTTNKTIVGAINELDTSVGGIDDLIPAQATSSNQLADKEFVNSSISSNTANFIGTFASIPALNNYSGTITNNDYAIVVTSVITDGGNDWSSTTALNAYDKTLLTNFDYAWVINGANFDLYRFDIVNQNWVLRVTNTSKAAITLNTAYNRYKATVAGTPQTVTWNYEYTLNNSSFTAAQWAAINSGITAAAVSQISTNTSNISTNTTNIGLKQNITDNNLTTTNKTIVGAINELKAAYGNANATLESILGV